MRFVRPPTLWLGLGLVLVLCLLGRDSPASSSGVPDNQVEAYTPQFHAFRTQGGSGLTIQPFFSPTSSTKMLVQLIDDAKESLYVINPRIRSWITCEDRSAHTYGCTPETYFDNATDPVFWAILNAYHRGVDVYILSNYFDQDMTDGSIKPNQYFRLAGMNVKYYRTTSFLHSKVMMVDPTSTDWKVAISSINFSKTSMLYNREAGLVFAGGSAHHDLRDYWTSVFQYDWAAGEDWPVPEDLSPAAKAVFKHKSQHPVDIPDVIPPAKSVTPVSLPLATDAALNITVGVSPDFALPRLLEALKGTPDAPVHSVVMEMFELSSSAITAQLVKLLGDGKEVTVFAAPFLGSPWAYLATMRMYKELYEANGTVRMLPTFFRYWHQKVMLIWHNEDRTDATLWLSTGNIATVDYPDRSAFPAKGQSGHTSANRDYIVYLRAQQGTAGWSIISVFRDLIVGDSKYATPFHPK